MRISRIVHDEAVVNERTRKVEDQVGSGFGMKYGARMSHTLITYPLADSHEISESLTSSKPKAEMNRNRCSCG